MCNVSLHIYLFIFGYNLFQQNYLHLTDLLAGISVHETVKTAFVMPDGKFERIPSGLCNTEVIL